MHPFQERREGVSAHDSRPSRIRLFDSIRLGYSCPPKRHDGARFMRRPKRETDANPAVSLTAPCSASRDVDRIHNPSARTVREVPDPTRIVTRGFGSHYPSPMTSTAPTPPFVRVSRTWAWRATPCSFDATGRLSRTFIRRDRRQWPRWRSRRGQVRTPIRMPRFPPRFRFRTDFPNPATTGSSCRSNAAGVERPAPSTPRSSKRRPRFTPRLKLLPRPRAGHRENEREDEFEVATWHRHESSLNQYRLPARGARIARRGERAYWAYVSDEQRREAGCPARQAVVIQRGQATS